VPCLAVLQLPGGSLLLQLTPAVLHQLQILYRAGHPLPQLLPAGHHPRCQQAAPAAVGCLLPAPMAQLRLPAAHLLAAAALPLPTVAPGAAAPPLHRGQHTWPAPGPPALHLLLALLLLALLLLALLLLLLLLVVVSHPPHRQRRLPEE
jgi:hypothetical protein